MNDYFFFSAPQLKRDPLGGCRPSKVTSTLLLNLGATAAGAAAVAYYVWAAMQAHASLHWPTVEGRVSKSSLEIRPGRLGRTYAPDVTYTYQAAGLPYTSRRIFFGQGLFSTHAAGFAETRRERYKEGSTVRVYVHPRKPARAVLEPGIWPDQFLPAIFWAFLLVWGVLALAGVM